jgi:hypothetical protein
MSEHSLIASGVVVTLNGEQFTLSFPANAFITYADRLNSDLLVDFDTIGKRLANVQQDPAALTAGFRLVRGVLWVGLLEHHPAITLEDAGRLFSMRDFQTVITAIAEAMQLTLPAADPQRKRPTKPAAKPAVRHSQPIDGLDSGVNSVPLAASAPESSGV